MEPEVKKEHRYLPVLITVLVMILVTVGTAVGVWYYMDQQVKKTADENAKQIAELQNQVDNLNKESDIANPSTESNDPTSEWKTYTNGSWGITFKYPSTYTVEEDTVKNPGFAMAGNLQLVDNSRPGKPNMNMLFNPDGLGGCMLDSNDYHYETAITNNKVSITKKELQSSSGCPDNNLVKTMFEIGKPNYIGTFKNGILASYFYSQGAYQLELDQIIGTINISKPELYGN